MRFRDAIKGFLKRKKHGASEKGTLTGKSGVGEEQVTVNRSSGENGVDSQLLKPSTEQKTEVKGATLPGADEARSTDLALGPPLVNTGEGSGLGSAEEEQLPPVDELKELESASAPFSNGPDLAAQHRPVGEAQGTKQKTSLPSAKQPWGSVRASTHGKSKLTQDSAALDKSVLEAQQRAQERLKLRQTEAAKRKEEDPKVPEDTKKSKPQGWGARSEGGSNRRSKLSAPTSPTRSDMSTLSDSKYLKKGALQSDAESTPIKPKRTSSLPSTSRLLSPTISSMQRSAAAAKDRTIGSPESPSDPRRASDPPLPSRFSPQGAEKERRPSPRVSPSGLAARKAESANGASSSSPSPIKLAATASLAKSAASTAKSVGASLTKAAFGPAQAAASPAKPVASPPPAESPPVESEGTPASKSRFRGRRAARQLSQEGGADLLGEDPPPAESLPMEEPAESEENATAKSRFRGRRAARQLSQEGSTDVAGDAEENLPQREG